MRASILQLHTWKNERLTLGTARVTKDRNNGDAANTLGDHVISREDRLAGVAPERLLSKARVVTSCKVCPEAGSITANAPIRPISLMRIRLIRICGKGEGRWLPKLTEIPYK